MPIITGAAYDVSEINQVEFPSLDREGWREAPGWFDRLGFDYDLMSRMRK